MKTEKDIEEILPTKLKFKVSWSISFQQIKTIINKIKDYVRK